MFLPSGYPRSVTPDYVEYQLWALPVHITGWMAHSLVTSSMLKAVGVGMDPAGTAATGAAIKWITKDGFGALGRYLVGSTLARYFDEDPRQWRLFADYVNAFGSLLEISTAAFPASAFTLLAGAGNFAKAFGKGISRPSFRVIQQHFAASHNIGDVAAKEEVWEVTGQLTGLALSVLLLDALQQQQDAAGTLVVSCWVAITAVHLVLRYKSLSVLQFPSVSQKRACLLAKRFVQTGTVPGVAELCSKEPLALPKQAMDPVLFMNASVLQLSTAAQHLSFAAPRATSNARDQHSNDITGRDNENAQEGNGTGGAVRHRSGSSSSKDMPSEDTNRVQAALDGSTRPISTADIQPDHLGAALALYAAEDYVLLPDGLAAHAFPLSAILHKQRYLVALKANCEAAGQLKAMLQAAWLSKHCGTETLTVADVRASLAAADKDFPQFLHSLDEAGWNTSDVAMHSPQLNVLVDAGGIDR